MSISYSAIVLDEVSRSNLLGRLGDLVPQDWGIVLHHMTITMGPLVHPRGKHDFSQSYPLGTPVTLQVTHFGKDSRAAAVKVMPPSEISQKIKFPHVTVAVNREEGGKAFHSNKIPPLNFNDISSMGIILKGHVVEIPN
jgi:hypothetical protein